MLVDFLLFVSEIKFEFLLIFWFLGCIVCGFGLVEMFLVNISRNRVDNLIFKMKREVLVFKYGGSIVLFVFWGLLLWFGKILLFNFSDRKRDLLFGIWFCYIFIGLRL